VKTAKWLFIAISPHLVIFPTVGVADAGSSRPGRFYNGRRPHVGGGYALIAAMSGLVPMMFMTRVRL
jgi:hypothetical protein